MKNLLLIVLGSFISISPFILQAQEGLNETVNIKLSNPASAGTLIMDLHIGGIKIITHNGGDVNINMIANKPEKEDGASKHPGMKKIPNNTLNVEIIENNNIVKVDGGHDASVNFIVKVPRNFSLKLNTHHDGDVSVDGVKGDIEINTHHGGVTIDNVEGSAVVDTHHGGIKASFTSVDNSKPMAFSTYHGDVDITFPGSVSCVTKIKTSKGDIYTDFELNMKPAKVSNESTSEGMTKIKVGEWMHGSIGSGGKEYMFSTYHGDVILRKK